MTSRISDVLIEDTLSSSYLRYSLTVILNRALPDARDGLKPVHRRILYTMADMGCFPNKPYIKVAKVVGATMGSYHPHGDSAISDALVRMGQDFSMRYPLIEGQGNFGNIDGSPAAAMRYIESRLSHNGESMLFDIKKNVVDVKANYDESTDEPVYLPSALPHLIVNGGSGIAVGMASNMASHNLREVANAIKAYAANDRVTVDDLLEYVQGPDFATGGTICGTSGFRQAMRTGRGVVTIRANYEIETASNGRNSIVFRDIPYGLNSDSVVAKIRECIKGKVIEGISDLADESTEEEGLRIVVSLKMNTIPDVVINQLYKHTPLQSNFSYNNMAIYKDRPKLLNLLDMVQIYVDHRVDVITRRFQYDLDKAQSRVHILEGLRLVQTNIDGVVKIIRAADDQASARTSLAEKYSLSDKQTEAIVSMRLGQLTSMDCNKLAKEMDELLSEIAKITETLSSRANLLDVMVFELDELVSKLGDERKSTIGFDADDIGAEDMIPDDEMVVTITKEGYIKRVPLDAYRTQGRGGTGMNAANMKDDDYVTGIYQASNKSYLMFFTNLGRAHWLKVWNIPEGSRTTKGKALINFLTGLQDGEKVQVVVPVKSFDDDHFFMFATREGLINKMKASHFSNPRKAGVNAINIVEGDALVSVLYANASENLVLATSHGQAITFAADAFGDKGRNTTGVRGIRLAMGDAVVGFLHLDESTKIITVTEKGYGKRTNPDDYRVTGRGGKGVRNITVSNKTGPVVYVGAALDTDDLIVTTRSGTLIRTAVSSISEQGRAAQGVRVINLRDLDSVMDAVCVANDSTEPVGGSSDA